MKGLLLVAADTAPHSLPRTAKLRSSAPPASSTMAMPVPSDRELPNENTRVLNTCICMSSPPRKPPVATTTLGAMMSMPLSVCRPFTAPSSMMIFSPPVLYKNVPPAASMAETRGATRSSPPVSR